jgi:transcriptional regulator with XRE-family HTH domain
MRTRHAIGHVLRKRRQELRLTLREVNQHISYAYLSEVERGKKDISADLLDVLTKSLEFSRAEFMIQVAKVLEEGANEPARF